MDKAEREEIAATLRPIYEAVLEGEAEIDREKTVDVAALYLRLDDGARDGFNLTSHLYVPPWPDHGRYLDGFRDGAIAAALLVAMLALILLA